MARQVDQIETEIKAELESGKSMFQVAIGLSEEDRIVIHACDNPTSFPYARVAAWFFDFFDESDGLNFRQASWHQGESDLADACWHSVFPGLELSNETFKSQCWLLNNKEKGRTSHLWAGIKQCLDLPPDNRFTVESYDNPPKYIRHLLAAYQRGESSGADFADFVEAFESSSGEGQWHHILYSACKEKFSDRANLGIYLHWSGGVSCGIGIGIDRIRGSRSSTLYFDGQRKDKPTRNKFYPLEGATTRVRFCGTKFDVPPDVSGVFYRYISDFADARSAWWKQVPKNGVIPFSRDELLVCIGEEETPPASGVYDEATIDVGEPFELRVQNHGEDRSIRMVRVVIKDRPYRESKIQFSHDWQLNLAGRVPRIVVSCGEAEGLSAGDLAVCSGHTAFSVSGLQESYVCQWQCDGCDVCEGPTYSFTGEGFGEDSLRHLKVRCRILDVNGNLVSVLPPRHIAWIPKRVSEKLLAGGDVHVHGWRISKSKDDVEVIRDRIRNRVRYKVESPDGEIEDIYAQAAGMFFWFARELADWEEDGNHCKEKLFFVKGDVEGWHLCVPANVQFLDFRIDDKAVRNPEAEPINGVWRIPLSKLIPDDEGYVYNPDLSLQSLTCNGTLVASVGDAPKQAFLCQDLERKWGVYIPDGEPSVYKAVLYTDNTLDRHFMEPLVVHGLKTESNSDPFHSLDSLFLQQGESDSVGEWHLALMPDTDAFPELLMLGRFLDSACQIRVVRPNSATYPPDQNHALLKVIQTQLKVPEGHVYAKSRLARYSEALKLDEVEDYWKTFADSGSVESLPEALKRLLKSDYNFLADPHWYFGAFDLLIEGRRKRLELERITNRVREDVCKMLVDNGDGKEDMFKGIGCCSAIVAQRKFDGFDELVDAHEKIKIREVTRLLSENRKLSRLGISAEIDANGYTVHWSLLKTNRRTIELENNTELAYDHANSWWEIRRNRGGRSMLAQGFVFKKFTVDPKKFVRVHYGDFSDVSAAKTILADEGVSSESLDVLKEQ